MPYSSPLITAREEKVFDSQYEDMDRKPPEIEVEGIKVSVKPGELKSIKCLQQHTNSFKPEDVSAQLGLKVINVEGMPVYKGSKFGLELHCQWLGERILVFSFGEFQPDRYICKLEAILS